MTDAELKGIAAQCLNMAKTHIQRGGFNFLLANYHYAEKELHRMSRVEDLVVERLGADWLGDWRRKAGGFSLLRQCNEKFPSDALVFVTAGNTFIGTPKFFELPEDRQEALRTAGHAEHHRAVAAGLLTLSDVLVAIAQTPERVCIYKQRVNEHYQFTGAPECSFCSQHDFDGNLKMYGAPPSESAAS